MRKYQKTFTKPSRTKQAHKDECDINKILSKYEKTNLMTHVNRYQGSYGDFSNIEDYQSALNQVMEAQSAFVNLPANIRKRFGNSPSEYLKFFSDEKNYEEAIELGFMNEDATTIFNKRKAELKAASSQKNDDKTTNKE